MNIGLLQSFFKKILIHLSVLTSHTIAIRVPTGQSESGGVRAPRNKWGVLGLNSFHPFRGFLKAYAFVQTMIDTNQYLSRHSYLSRLSSLLLFDPSEQITQPPRSSGVLLGSFHQNPSQPFGPLLGNLSMIGNSSRLKGRRAEAAERNQLLGLRESVNLSNLCQNEHGRVFPNPFDGEEQFNPWVLFRKMLNRMSGCFNLLLENFQDFKILVKKRLVRFSRCRPFQPRETRFPKKVGILCLDPQFPKIGMNPVLDSRLEGHHEGSMSENLSQIRHLSWREIGLRDQIGHPQMSQDAIVNSIRLDLGRSNRLGLEGMGELDLLDQHPPNYFSQSSRAKAKT
jgi:hypothetical protein